MGPQGGNYVVTIPKDRDWTSENHERVIADAIAAHQEATGYYGPVVIMPEMLTIEEWTERSARLRLADGDLKGGIGLEIGSFRPNCYP